MSYFSSQATRALGLACAVFAGGACQSPSERPEQSLERFIGHVQRGKAEAAWKALSTQTREQLMANHEALAQAAGRPATREIDVILFDELRLRAPADPDTMAVVGPITDQARVSITIKGAPRAEVWMVREGGAWKVDLSRSLRAPVRPFQAPPPPAQRAPAEAPGRPDTSTPSDSKP